MRRCGLAIGLVNRLGAILLGGLIAWGAAGDARSADLKPFKIAISTPVVSILPVYLAQAGGFYEKQGLAIDIISTEGGTRGIQVLLSGEIQAMHVGLSPVVAANAQGADVRAIASTTNTLPITIFAAKATTPPLPKGTVIGISTLGSETDIALTVALRALGLARADMQITQIGGTSQRFAAMTAGRIQAAPLLEPGTSAARQKGYTAVYDLSAANTPWIFDAVVMTTSYLKDHPDDVQSFLKAYVEGAYWGMANEAKAKEVIAARFKTRDPVVIDASYAEFKRLMPRDAKPSVEGAQNILKELQATGLQVPSQKVEDYLDLMPIETLQKSGFIAEMQQRYGVQ
jgi:NitT/TauT family transport system substrate-binding protein